MTEDGLFAEILEDLAEENPCDCGGETEAEHVATQTWHGVTVTCRKCGSLVAEIDDPEGGWV
jgi:hypothetical protein